MVSLLLEILPGASVLVIDDNSPDGTGDLADAIATGDSRVNVLHRAGKQGLGAAYRAAFEQVLYRAECDVVVQMDCDLSHDSADVPRLLAALDSGRAGPRQPLRAGGAPPAGRSVGASAAAAVPLPDRPRPPVSRPDRWLQGLASGPPSHHRPRQRWNQGYGFQIEMTWRAHRGGARITEVPIVFLERRAGQSKMSRAIIGEALVMVLRLRLGLLAGGGPGGSASFGVGHARRHRPGGWHRRHTRR